MRFLKILSATKWTISFKDISSLSLRGIARCLGVQYIKYALSNPAYYRVMYGSYVSDYQKYPSVERAAEKSFAILTKAIAQGQETGVIRSGNTGELGYVCWSLVHGVSMLYLDRQLRSSEIESVDKLAHLATGMMLEGLLKSKCSL